MEGFIVTGAFVSFHEIYALGYLREADSVLESYENELKANELSSTICSCTNKGYLRTVIQTT